MEQDIEAILIQAASDLKKDIHPHLLTLRDAIFMYSTYRQTNQLGRATSQTETIIKILEETRKWNPEPTYAKAVSSLRHDINQPLTAILGYLSLFSTPELEISQENVMNYLNIISQCIAKIDLWLEIDQTRTVTLGEIVDKAYHLFHEDDAETQYTGRETDKLGVTTAPSFAVRKVYQGMHNAHKAKKNGAPVQIKLYTEADSKYGIIAVEDNGTGIDPKVILAAAREAGYHEEPATLYDTLCLIFKQGVSGFKHMGKQGNGVGMTSSALGEGLGQKVTLETTVLYDGKLLTIDEQHPNGYENPAKTRGTTVRYYLPLSNSS